MHEVRRRRSEVGRSRKELHRVLVLPLLEVHPAERRERELAQLFRRVAECELRGLERLIQRLFHLGEVVRLLVVRDRLRVIRRVGVQHLLERAIRFLVVAFRAQRLDQRRVRGRGDDFRRPVLEDVARDRHRLAVQVEVRTEQRIRHQNVDVVRILAGRATIVIESLDIVAGSRQRLRLAQLLRCRTFHRNVSGDAFVDPDCLLVLHLVRIELERFLEALDGLTVPVAIEIAEAEVVDRFLEVGIELDRFLQRANGALELPLLVEDRAEKVIGLRDRLELDCLLEELLGA